MVSLYNKVACSPKGQNISSFFPASRDLPRPQVSELEVVEDPGRPVAQEADWNKGKGEWFK